MNTEYQLYLPFDIDPGDVNGDNNIDILDVVLMVNGILGVELTPEQFWAADMNQNGIVNVLDIIIVVNIILGR